MSIKNLLSTKPLLNLPIINRYTPFDINMLGCWSFINRHLNIYVQKGTKDAQKIM
jgi:hypothetical protein